LEEADLNVFIISATSLNQYSLPTSGLKRNSTSQSSGDNNKRLKLNPNNSEKIQKPSTKKKEERTKLPKGSIPLGKTIQIMKNGETWFNDEVMNSFFALLSKKYPKVGFLSSYFLHLNSSHWTDTQNTVQAFQKGKIGRILIPFHIPGHWTTLLISSLSERVGIFAILDSLAASTEEVPCIVTWLEKTFPSRSWRLVNPFSEPHQNDSVNCGVYSCFFAELAARGMKLQQIDAECKNVNIWEYRNKILGELEAGIEDGTTGNKPSEVPSTVDSF